MLQLQQFGKAFLAAIQLADDQPALWNTSLPNLVTQLNSPNITVQSLTAVNGVIVSDAILAALVAAGRSCQQPDVPESRSGPQDVIVQG